MQREHLGVIRVELPEHGYVDLPLAGLGRRGFAAIVDFSLVLLVLLLVLLSLGLLLGSAQAASTAVVASVAIAVPVVVPLIVELVGRGVSPGKRWMKLRVLGSNGHPATAGQLVLRNLLRLVDFLPASYGLGLVLLAATQNSQRLGDLVAGTLVVSEAPDAWEMSGGEPRRRSELAGVPPALSQALSTLCSRREALDPEVFERRRATLLERFRTLRPDWNALDDESLWTELTKR